MFGLMQPEQICAHHEDENYVHYRMHYCGTCKAIGQDYGQKARLMLNFDAVFLAELLADLAKEDRSQWSDAYQAINRCFTLPKAKEETPLALQYAAASNVLLAEFKIDDNIKDRAKRRWKFARWLFSKSFQKVEAQFTTWGIDASLLWEKIQEQQIREDKVNHEAETLEGILDYYAAPTAELTSMIFGQGADVLGLNAEVKGQLEQLGYAFGALVYGLDALEDYYQDIRQKQFNPLRIHFEDKALVEEQEKLVHNYLHQLETNLANILQDLPISEERQAYFAARMTSNLANRMYVEYQPEISWKERIKQRWSDAKEVATRLTCEQSTFFRRLNYHLISLAVFVAPQAGEHLVDSEVKGEVFSWMAFMTGILASVGLSATWYRGRGSRKDKKEERKKKRQKRKEQRKPKSQNCLGGMGSCCGCCFNCCTNCGAVLFWGGLIFITLLIVLGIAFLSGQNVRIFWGLFLLLMGIFGALAVISYVVMNPGCMKFAKFKNMKACKKRKRNKKKRQRERERNNRS